jgi:pimeloyl-ACP methyl ester carboxylesterase
VKELGGEVRRLEGISHQIPFEAPEEVARAVRDLIERVYARRSSSTQDPA